MSASVTGSCGQPGIGHHQRPRMPGLLAGPHHLGKAARTEEHRRRIAPGGGERGEVEGQHYSLLPTIACVRIA